MKDYLCREHVGINHIVTDERRVIILDKYWELELNEYICQGEPDQQIVSTTSYIPYYYSNVKSRNEIDFLIQIKGDVIPIEVKAEEKVRARWEKMFYNVWCYNNEKYGR